MRRLLAGVLALSAAGGCLGSDPYRRLARDLADPLGKTPRRVAVLPFRGLDPRLNAEGEAISERLLSHLYGRAGVELVERSRLQQLMSELSLGQTGALDAKSAAELGRLSGAQALVVGTVARGRRWLEVSARVVDVASGRLLAAATARLPEGRNGGAAAQAPLPPAPRPAPTRTTGPLDRGWRPGADLGDGNRAPWPIDVFGAAVAARRLYVIGGATGRVRGAGLGDDAVFSAPVTREGPLGRWRAEEPLPEGRYQVGAAAWGNWLFAVGGYSGSPRDEVFAARVGAGGALGPWKTAGRLPVGCTLPGVVAEAGTLHVAGCSASTGQVHILFSAPISEDGVLGAWLRTPLPTDGGAGNSIASDGRRLILVGGTLDQGGFTPAVYAVPLSRLGEPGAASEIGALPMGLTGAPVAVADGRLWVLGGKARSEGKDVIRDAVDSAALAAQGMLGPWKRLPRKLLPAAANPYAPFVDGVFYVVGGETVSGRVDDVQRVSVR